MYQWWNNFLNDSEIFASSIFAAILILLIIVLIILSVKEIKK